MEEENLHCALCKSLAYSAVSCKGCKKNYCQECYTTNNSVCISCRMPNTCEVNHKIRQMVSKCQHCNLAYINSIPHQGICPKERINCPICASSIFRNELQFHHYNSHFQQILLKFGDPVYRIK